MSVGGERAPSEKRPPSPRFPLLARRRAWARGRPCVQPGLALRNEPGAIFRLLSCWALRGVDVLKVETRPLAAGRRAPAGLPPGMARLWDYLGGSADFMSITRCLRGCRRRPPTGSRRR
ncbi:unnamed protein product [Prorocentrum cordatum]|uniref:Uncharacterized protein n=1 Tax=Prorocentrum cordatum TaxID=2364126 RepID=A0ABN9QN64_9DINO|nr:unnamed protein product [Polarella glacialis]